MTWKRAALASTLLIACFGFVRQDTLSLDRTYKQGDSDVFDMKMNMEGSMPIVASMVLTTTVTKVYDNGDADVESAMTDFQVTMNGQAVPAPAPPKSTARMNKFGQTVGDGKPSMMGQLPGGDFMKYLKADGGLKVGQAIPVDSTDPKTNTKVKGTFTLVSIDAGVGKVTSSLDISNDKTADKPIHVDGTTLVDVATHKLNKMESKVTNLPARGGGPTFSSMTVEMTRRVK